MSRGKKTDSRGWKGETVLPPAREGLPIMMRSNLKLLANTLREVV